MQDIFNRLELRPFSYEEDAESVADMHCCAEVLEGYWFDKAETCKMHSKIVVRSPGSSWVLAYSSVVFAHADLIKQTNGEMSVIALRIHENYRYPQVAHALIQGLKREAKKRDASALVVFADNPQVDEVMKMIAIKPDRNYRYVNVSSGEAAKQLRAERVILHRDDVDSMDIHPLLGIPYPPAFLLQKAFFGADYAVFSHEKPTVFNIFQKNNNFLACHDGREWYVFKKGDFKVEKETISSLLTTLAAQKQGQILLSENAIALSGAVPTNDKAYNDYFIPLD
ncbi:MAG: hypothetical protein PHF29_10115 [Candidatus Riflebacteria bacterium]|nr:hypothetical protein [Candidatus Riflebacteria bacterium]